MKPTRICKYMMNKKLKTIRMNDQLPEYAYGNTMLQKYYREWLKKVEITAPYALTLTSSRPDLATQNKLANLKRISIR